MSFITHCGSRRVSESVLQKMGTADGTETHRPISHWDAFNRTATGLRAAGWEITSAKHAVNSRNDFSGLWDQYFGLMELKKIHGHDGAASSLDQEAGMVAGVRNAFSVQRCSSAITLPSTARSQRPDGTRRTSTKTSTELSSGESRC